MKKDFTKYEQAYALKELGFDEPCIKEYHLKKLLPNSTGFEISNSSLYQLFGDSKVIAAPTYSQAFRFFREKYELHSYIYSDYSWNISGGIWDLNGYKDLRYDWDSEPYATYEEAESVCLDKLIEIVKNKQD